MQNLTLYKAFRKELDTYSVPLILTEVKTYELWEDEIKKGILCMHDTYIDCLYILPQYRRRGLGKALMLDYIKQYGMPETLRIINNNTPALNFWNSLFELTPIERSPIDTLYRIEALKPQK